MRRAGHRPPIVHAISAVAEVAYAEIVVASISSKSAGPGTRANIDEFTETTAHALEVVGGAQRGKAIIILNPAEPPVAHARHRVLPHAGPTRTRSAAVTQRVAAVAAYVPGYRLKQDVQFDVIDPAAPVTLPDGRTFDGLKVSVFLEVEGAAHYLPAYAGNLDIMTSAAVRTGQAIAASLLASADDRQEASA